MATHRACPPGPQPTGRQRQHRVGSCITHQSPSPSPSSARTARRRGGWPISPSAAAPTVDGHMRSSQGPRKRRRSKEGLWAQGRRVQNAQLTSLSSEGQRDGSGTALWSPPHLPLPCTAGMPTPPLLSRSLHYSCCFGEAPGVGGDGQSPPNSASNHLWSQTWRSHRMADQSPSL